MNKKIRAAQVTLFSVFFQLIQLKKQDHDQQRSEIERKRTSNEKPVVGFLSTTIRLS